MNDTVDSLENRIPIEAVVARKASQGSGRGVLCICLRRFLPSSHEHSFKVAMRRDQSLEAAHLRFSRQHSATVACPLCAAMCFVDVLAGRSTHLVCATLRDTCAQFRWPPFVLTLHHSWARVD